MPALDARVRGAQAPGLSRGSGEDATPTPAAVGGRSSAFSLRMLELILEHRLELRTGMEAAPPRAVYKEVSS